ncbi:MAG: zinc-dependent metalloprotease [Planctomycetota bacterium]|nr:zinc-dependent metalloprotease [Planctomycetota bacterium]
MHRLHLLLAAACAILAARPAAAGITERIPFPMQASGVELSLRADVALELAGHESVVLVGVPLPGGPVDVFVRRARADLDELDLRVDGRPARYVEDPLASTWRGRIVGIPDSDVLLGFSGAGSRGWIQSHTDLWHLLAGPGPNGDWNSSISRFATEAELLRGGARPMPSCDARPVPGSQPTPNPRASSGSQALMAPPGDTRLCRIAVETDYQLYQRFNNLNALTAYMNQLFAATSARYDADVQTQVQVVQLGLHSNPNDGWVSGDNGAGAGAMLDEFRNAWSGNLPNGAHLAHFVSGAGLGGGVAYLNVLCNSQYGFGVSGDLAGNTPFPVMQGPLSWDFFVVNHEIGHNFGSPHTHDYCPPLDECAPAGSFGQCQTTQTCSSSGTIMSYCHTCGNGMSNIAPVFHPANAATMRASIQASCLPVLCSAPQNYCGTAPNSYDPFGANITFYGSNRISQNNLVLATLGVPPNAFGLYFYGQNPSFAPFGNGIRCVGNPVFRLPIVQANVFGESDFVLDYNALPAGGSISAGQTWNFQLWYRNPAGGGAGFNLSDGLRVQFCP